MRADVAGRLAKSSEDFLTHIWPAYQAQFGDPVPVESVTANDFARELDVRSGIDMWLMSRDGHMRGLASRVQWGDKSWDTFTVRMKRVSGYATEFDKRVAQIATPGTVWPWYFCHGYMSKDRTRLIAAALARTADVIAAVQFGIGFEKPNSEDGTRFWCVPWRDLAGTGAQLQVVRPQ